MKIRYEHRKNCMIEVFDKSPYGFYFENNELIFFKKNGSRITPNDYKKIQSILDKFDPIWDVRVNAKLRIMQIYQDKFDEGIKEINKKYYVSGFEESFFYEMAFNSEDEPVMKNLSQQSLIMTHDIQDYINAYVCERRELLYQLLAKKLSLFNFIDNTDDIDEIMKCSLPDQK